MTGFKGTRNINGGSNVDSDDVDHQSGHPDHPFERAFELPF
jgi:hypothetical protein